MKIAVVADTHLAAHALDFLRNVEEAVAWIEAAGADLVIHLGDVTADGARDATHFDAAARAFGRLDVPLFAVPGNHDIGEPDGGHEPQLSPERLAAFRHAFGNDRWSHRAGHWTLIGLNTQILGTDEEPAQAEWLMATANAAPGPVALFLHKPWFLSASGVALPVGRYVPPASLKTIRRALAGSDLRLVVSGHVHQFRRHVVDKVEHAWVGSTAFVIPDRWQETIGRKATGLAMLTLNGNEYALEEVRPPAMRELDLEDYADVYPELLDRR